ncbi:MAG TPA: fatty acyl-AMP ligase, partial [Pyrinomonadaceae bacterium]|nr:fatty acyl-AMP ligase [Pyrinomonadaceae bacterium]
MSLERTEVEQILPRDSKARTLIELLRQRALHQPLRTAYTFLSEGQSEECLTYGGLEIRARAIAARLQTTVAPGERVLLLYPSGLEYICAFWGCIYAGVVPVPAYPPRANRNLARLRSIVSDAQAVAALAGSAIISRLQPLLALTRELQSLHWMMAPNDELGKLAQEWVEPDIDANTLAFLQYTSGSTAAPKGVMVTHGNLLHNEELIRHVFRQSEESVIVGWLPLYHDMGLIGNVLQPLYLGATCILFSPTTFLQQPYRWLEAISRYHATTSGGPNFAYDLCVDKITAAERATLDLSSWTTAFNGAEPIRAETLERFGDAFGPCGFRPEAFYPCYGLAEATLLVTGKLNSKRPSIRVVDAKTLENNRVVNSSAGNEGVRLLVGCGNVLADQRIVVVNPRTRVECSSDEVGEILVSGPSVA